MSKAGIKKSWAIPQSLLRRIVEEQDLELLEDFMIICKDGSVYPYIDEVEMLQAINQGSLCFDIDDIAHIVMNENPIKFRIKDRIRISTDNEPMYRIEELVHYQTRVNYNQIIVLNGPDEEIFTFISEEDMAAYLNTVEDSDAIAHVFSDGELQEIEKAKVLVLEFKEGEQEFEFEVLPVPF